MVWFDAFRRDFGPTWYGDNRTAVVTDTTTLTIFLVFAIFFIAFLVIFPGIRRERWSSFVSVTLSLSVGSILLSTIYYPSWHNGYVRIYSTYRAFSAEKLDAIIGVRIGLRHVNITLRGSPQAKLDHHLNYNERFRFDEVKSMEKELQEGLQKGLPYPILSVIEYLSVDRAGFIWGRQYRLAGYYTNILLWLSFSLWILQFMMLCLVPQYFSRSVLFLGATIGLADLVYFLASPKNLRISFPDIKGEITSLEFHFGWCFWATLVSGGLCIIVGSVIRILELKTAFHFVTFLQADYDEVSATPRKKNKRREDTNLGSRESLGSDYPDFRSDIQSITSDEFVEATAMTVGSRKRSAAVSDSTVMYHTARADPNPKRFYEQQHETLPVQPNFDDEIESIPEIGKFRQHVKVASINHSTPANSSYRTFPSNHGPPDPGTSRVHPVRDKSSLMPRPGQAWAESSSDATIAAVREYLENEKRDSGRDAMEMGRLRGRIRSEEVYTVSGDVSSSLRNQTFDLDMKPGLRRVVPDELARDIDGRRRHSISHRLEPNSHPKSVSQLPRIQSRDRLSPHRVV